MTIEKLRSLLPEAVDIVAEVIRDKDNPQRVKYALELIKAMKASELLSDMSGPTEAQEIITNAAESKADQQNLTFGPDNEQE